MAAASARLLVVWFGLLVGNWQIAASQVPGSFKPRDLLVFERNKAEALLTTRYPCLGCHELNGSGGRIGPSLTDVADRRSPQYVYAMISDPQGTVPGTVMPRVAMREAAIELVTNYLTRGNSRGTTDSSRAALSSSAPASIAGDGAALYGRFCSACHGASGKGDGPNARFLRTRPAPLASRESTSLRSDDALFDTIYAGGYIMNRSNLMPPFGGTLTREQIWSLVRHIRSLCACEGPEWSRDK